jgi:lipoprotein-releasing system ATP-binding protein
VGLLGPSGCGKTTLLQIAGLLDTPSSGEVIIADKLMNCATDITCTQARNKFIGFIYQFHHLLPEFSAVENVMLPQMIAGITRNSAMTRASLLLHDLGLSQRLHHRPAALSGGEQQRVAIARALSNKPSLILADEPTGNLDPVTADYVFNLLVSMVREKNVAMVVATHNMELAKRMDRVVNLQNGSLNP